MTRQSITYYHYVYPPQPFHSAERPGTVPRSLHDSPNILKLKDLPELLAELVEIDRIPKRRAAQT